MVNVVAGTVGGLAACALALQASGTRQASESQAATSVAVATAAASVVTIGGAIGRFRSDIRWRRWHLLAVSIVIAGASVVAATILALVASRAIRLGTAGQGVVIGVAAVTAFAGAVSDVYSDERALVEGERQERLAQYASLLLVDALGKIKIEPADLEVILMIAARNLLRPRRKVLRLGYSVCIGMRHKHSRVIRKSGANALEKDHTKPLWDCYETGSTAVQAMGESSGRSFFKVTWHSKLPSSVWAAPICVKEKVIGVLALQAYSSYESRDGLAGTSLDFDVEGTAVLVSAQIQSDR